MQNRGVNKTEIGTDYNLEQFGKFFNNISKNNGENNGENPIKGITPDYTMKIYNDFGSNLDYLKTWNPKLFMNLHTGPLEAEGLPMEAFKDKEKTWGLTERLAFFYQRLTEEYGKNYENTILCYCVLFLKLEINPLRINKADEILRILETN